MDRYDRKNPEPPIDTICVTLYSRGNGQTFHWSIAIPHGYNVATEYQADNFGNDGWSKPWELIMRETNLTKSRHASVVVVIGKLNGHTVDQVTQILKAVPVPPPNPAEAVEEFDAKVWVRQSVRALNNAGVIRCPDAIALEDELVQFAVDNDFDTGVGGPYKVHIATKSS